MDLVRIESSAIECDRLRITTVVIAVLFSHVHVQPTTLWQPSIYFERDVLTTTVLE